MCGGEGWRRASSRAEEIVEVIGKWVGGEGRGGVAWSDIAWRGVG